MNPVTSTTNKQTKRKYKEECDACKDGNLFFIKSGTELCTSHVNIFRTIIEECSQDNKRRKEMYADKKCIECKEDIDPEDLYRKEALCSHCKELAYVCKKCSDNNCNQDNPTYCTHCRERDLSDFKKCVYCYDTIHEVKPNNLKICHKNNSSECTKICFYCTKCIKFCKEIERTIRCKFCL
jgi:hypothetical protein